jgi:hypothetical protein
MSAHGDSGAPLEQPTNRGHEDVETPPVSRRSRIVVTDVEVAADEDGAPGQLAEVLESGYSERAPSKHLGTTHGRPVAVVTTELAMDKGSPRVRCAHRDRC